jgi:hypothetical protein
MVEGRAMTDNEELSDYERGVIAGIAWMVSKKYRWATPLGQSIVSKGYVDEWRKEQQ